MPNIDKDPRFWMFNTKIGRAISWVILILIISYTIYDKLNNS